MLAAFSHGRHWSAQQVCAFKRGKAEQGVGHESGARKPGVADEDSAKLQKCPGLGVSRAFT